MFLTIDILKKHNACKQGMDWFEHFFPNGGTVLDVINHRMVTHEILHWGFENLTTTAEEKEIYRKKLHIDCENPETIYLSDNVTSSKWVTRSSNITDSEHIFSCKNIENCANLSHSDDVQNSTQIFGSEFVDDSCGIVHSKNVTKSRNVISSDYVVNSHSIMNAAAVTNSAFVGSFVPGGAKQIKNSRFVAESTNLNHCLFCVGLHDAEYMVFNKKVDSEEYELILKQLDKILMGWDAELVKDNEWPAYTIPLDTPNIQRNVLKQYAALPESFWRWVKTLPGYDPSILYHLTYNRDLL